MLMYVIEIKDWSMQMFMLGQPLDHKQSLFYNVVKGSSASAMLLNTGTKKTTALCKKD